MTDQDAALLDLAGRFYRQPGARDQAVVEELGVSPVRFWQRVNSLLDDPAALEVDAPTVRRLQRLRARRLRQRGH